MQLEWAPEKCCRLFVLRQLKMNVYLYRIVCTENVIYGKVLENNPVECVSDAIELLAPLSFKQIHLKYAYSFNLLFRREIEYEVCLHIREIIALYAEDVGMVDEVIQVEDLSVTGVSHSFGEWLLNDKIVGCVPNWSGCLLVIKCATLTRCNSMLKIFHNYGYAHPDKVLVQAKFDVYAAIATQIFVECACNPVSDDMKTSHQDNVPKKNPSLRQTWHRVTCSTHENLFHLDWLAMPGFYTYCNYTNHLMHISAAPYVSTPVPTVSTVHHIKIDNRLRFLCQSATSSETTSLFICAVLPVVTLGTHVYDTTCSGNSSNVLMSLCYQITSLCLRVSYMNLTVYYMLYVAGSCDESISDNTNKSDIKINVADNLSTTVIVYRLLMKNEHDLLDFFFQLYSDGKIFTNINLPPDQPHILQGAELLSTLLPNIVNRILLLGAHATFERYVLLESDKNNCLGSTNSTGKRYIYRIHPSSIQFDAQRVVASCLGGQQTSQSNLFADEKINGKKLDNKNCYASSILKSAENFITSQVMINSDQSRGLMLDELQKCIDTVADTFTHHLNQLIEMSCRVFLCDIETAAMGGTKRKMEILFSMYTHKYERFPSVNYYKNGGCRLSVCNYARIISQKHIERGFTLGVQLFPKLTAPFDDNNQYQCESEDQKREKKKNNGGIHFALPNVYGRSLHFDFVSFYPGLFCASEVSSNNLEVFSRSQLIEIGKSSFGGPTLTQLLETKSISIWACHSTTAETELFENNADYLNHFLTLQTSGRSITIAKTCITPHIECFEQLTVGVDATNIDNEYDDDAQFYVKFNLLDKTDHDASTSIIKHFRDQLTQSDCNGTRRKFLKNIVNSFSGILGSDNFDYARSAHVSFVRWMGRQFVVWLVILVRLFAARTKLSLANNKPVVDKNCSATATITKCVLEIDTQLLQLKQIILQYFLNFPSLINGSNTNATGKSVCRKANFSISHDTLTECQCQQSASITKTLKVKSVEKLMETTLASLLVVHINTDGVLLASNYTNCKYCCRLFEQVVIDQINDFFSVDLIMPELQVKIDCSSNRSVVLNKQVIIQFDVNQRKSVHNDKNVNLSLTDANHSQTQQTTGEADTNVNVYNEQRLLFGNNEYDNVYVTSIFRDALKTLLIVLDSITTVGNEPAAPFVLFAPMHFLLNIFKQLNQVAVDAVQLVSSNTKFNAHIFKYVCTLIPGSTSLSQQQTLQVNLCKLFQSMHCHKLLLNLISLSNVNCNVRKHQANCSDMLSETIETIRTAYSDITTNTKFLQFVYAFFELTKVDGSTASKPLNAKRDTVLLSSAKLKTLIDCNKINQSVSTPNKSESTNACITEKIEELLLVEHNAMATVTADNLVKMRMPGEHAVSFASQPHTTCNLDRCVV